MGIIINTSQYNGDPNVLVHIAAFKIGTMTLPGVARIASGITTRNGIATDEKVDLDTRRILEALASLSVCDERLQVVAVSMQIDEGAKSVTLSFAENGLVSPRIKPHITNLWNLLEEMSKHHAGEEKIDIKACQASFLGHVYPYSLPKIRKRFKSWMPLLKAFVEAAAKNDTNPPGDLLPRFQAIEKSLDLVHSTLDKTGDQRALEKLIHEMDSVLETWESIRAECEGWLKSFASPPPYIYPVVVSPLIHFSRIYRRTNSLPCRPRSWKACQPPPLHARPLFRRCRPLFPPALPVRYDSPRSDPPAGSQDQDSRVRGRMEIHHQFHVPPRGQEDQSGR